MMKPSMNKMKRLMFVNSHTFKVFFIFFVVRKSHFRIMHAAIYSNAYAHDPSRDSKAPKRPDINECGLSCIEPVQILANRLHILYNTSTDTN